MERRSDVATKKQAALLQVSDMLAKYFHYYCALALLGARGSVAGVRSVDHRFLNLIGNILMLKWHECLSDANRMLLAVTESEQLF